jgi:predicted metal-dependent hydrolase
MQLEFQWRDEASLRRELEERIGLRLRLVVTDNTSTLMSLKEDGNGRADLRLHHMFLSASPDVVRALASWLKQPRRGRSGAVIDRFIREHGHLVREGPQRRTRVRTRGRRFDLRALFDEVNREQFTGAVSAKISWGKRPGGRRRRSIRFGSYCADENLIRIHPVLDQDFVPEYFIRYIVFHEMLHAHLGITEAPSGRQRSHTPEFRRRERAYPDYRRALAWHDRPRNLHRLLRG